jgi:hypothetical protein
VVAIAVTIVRRVINLVAPRQALDAPPQRLDLLDQFIAVQPQQLGQVHQHGQGGAFVAFLDRVGVQVLPLSNVQTHQLFAMCPLSVGQQLFGASGQPPQLPIA